MNDHHPARALMMRLVDEIADLSMARPADVERYRDLVAPGEPPERRALLSRVSGCALVVRGLLLRLGIRTPLLVAPPLVTRDERATARGALSSVVDLGRAAARTLDLDTRPPLPGDLLITHPAGRPQSPHIGVCTPHAPALLRAGAQTPPGALRVSSVDGGQVEPAAPVLPRSGAPTPIEPQAVRRRSTLWERHSHDGTWHSSGFGVLVGVADLGELFDRHATPAGYTEGELAPWREKGKP